MFRRAVRAASPVVVVAIARRVVSFACCTVNTRYFTTTTLLLNKNCHVIVRQQQLKQKARVKTNMPSDFGQQASSIKELARPVTGAAQQSRLRLNALRVAGKQRRFAHIVKVEV